MGIYLVMKNNFIRSIHHKMLFAVMFLLPVILCLIAGSVKFGKPSVRVGILGLDRNLEESEGKVEADNKAAIYRILDQSEGITYASADIGTVNMDLMTGKFQVILDYRGNLKEDFKLISFQKEQKKILLERMFREAFAKGEPIQLTGLKPEGLSVTERTIALLLSMFMMLSIVHTSMIIRDKLSGTYLRYQFAKQSGISYVAGYFIHCFLITFGQILLCIAALLLVQAGFTLTAVQVLLLSVTMAAIATAISMLISLGSKSEVQSNITASALAAVMSLLGGTFVAVGAMPGLLRMLSYGSPIRWVVELLKILR